jgi:hypothetical protein
MSRNDGGTHGPMDACAQPAERLRHLYECRFATESFNAGRTAGRFAISAFRVVTQALAIPQRLVMDLGGRLWKRMDTVR